MRFLLVYISTVLCIQSCRLDDSPNTFQYVKGDFWIENFQNNSFPSKAYRDDKIYCSDLLSGKANYFYCLNLKTGIVDWAASVGSWAAEPAIIEDSIIYYCGYLGDIYRFDKSGNQIWKKELATPYGGHCINPINKNLFVSTVLDGIFEYNSKDGSVENQYGRNTLGVTPPAFTNGLMFIAGLSPDSVEYRTTGDHLLCFDSRTGKEVWRQRIGDHVHRLFINDHSLYYFDKDYILNRIEISTGSPIWKSASLNTYFDGRAYSLAPHLIFEDSLIFYYDSDLSSIVKLSERDGKVLGKLSYWDALRENSLKPKKFSYKVIKDKIEYRIVVSDSLVTPEDKHKSYGLIIEKKSLN